MHMCFTKDTFKLSDVTAKIAENDTNGKLAQYSYKGWINAEFFTVTKLPKPKYYSKIYDS